MRNQLAAMADECREFTTGFNQTRMICAKVAGHVDDGDEYHHDPFHNVRWREIGVENTPAEVATRVAAYSAASTALTALEPLRPGVVYIRPIKQRSGWGNWLKAVWA